MNALKSVARTQRVKKPDTITYNQSEYIDVLNQKVVSATVLLGVGDTTFWLQQDYIPDILGDVCVTD